MKSLTALAVLEKAINAYLSNHPNQGEQFSELNGKTIAIDISGVEFKFFIVFSQQGVFLQHHCSGDPDLLIRAPLTTLLNLFKEQDMNQILFSKEMEVKGDLMLAQQVKLFFSGVEIEWEYYLSRVIGDAAANEAKRCFDNNKQRVKQFAKRLRGNVIDYLQEESGCLPSKNRAQDLFDSVDNLKNDVARFEQRVKRLARKRAQDKE